MLTTKFNHFKRIQPPPPPSRFTTDEAVHQHLTTALTRDLCQNLSLPAGTKLLKLSRVCTKGVGATQCRPYIIHLSNGTKFFLKLSPRNNNSILRQQEADSVIRSNLKDSDHCPIVFLTHGERFINDKIVNDMLFFPFVPGNNLFMTFDKHQSSELEELQYEQIGKTLATIHIQCMQHANTFEDFLAGDGKLPPVLVHADWQATNLMITPEPEYTAVWIDTEGTNISDRSYTNIAQTWELCNFQPNLMKHFLQGYVEQYPCDTIVKDKIYNEILHALNETHKINTDEFKGISPRPR